MKLEIASNSTPMVDFAIAINRILTHPCKDGTERKIFTTIFLRFLTLSTEKDMRA
jgi:hypothetical protein